MAKLETIFWFVVFRIVVWVMGSDNVGKSINSSKAGKIRAYSESQYKEKLAADNSSENSLQNKSVYKI